LQQRSGRHAIKRRADHGAVAGRGVEQIVGHLHAAGAGHILHDDGRLAWDVIMHVTRDEASDQIDAAAGRGRHHHLHGLACIEGCNVVVRARRRRPGGVRQRHEPGHDD